MQPIDTRPETYRLRAGPLIDTAVIRVFSMLLAAC
jgi:hypothetical protein